MEAKVEGMHRYKIQELAREPKPEKEGISGLLDLEVHGMY